MSTLVAFSVTPIGLSGNDGSVGDAVAAAVRVVRESGLANETNAMFTNVEGDWDEVMAVVKTAVFAVADVAPRVSVVIKVDHRPGARGALAAKVERIDAALSGRAEREAPGST